MDKHSSHYQAHLERISDYLLPGPDVWWKKTSQGIEFLDGPDENNYQDCGPSPHHFRSSSTTDIDVYLHSKWEELCDSGVELPATCVRYYGHSGLLQSISDLH